MNNTFSTGYYSQKYIDRETGTIKIPEYKRYHFHHVKDLIKESVGVYFSLTNGWLNNETRLTEYRLARQWCHFWAMQFNESTLSIVGEQYGNKHHATVINSCRAINNSLFVLPSGRATDETSQDHFRKMKGLIDVGLIALTPRKVRFREWRNLCRQRLVHKRAGRYYRLRTMKIAQLSIKKVVFIK